jgi:hypothetical protein
MSATAAKGETLFIARDYNNNFATPARGGGRA